MRVISVAKNIFSGIERLMGKRKSSGEKGEITKQPLSKSIATIKLKCSASVFSILKETSKCYLVLS